MTDDEMIKFIEDAFEQNYESLKLEGGHALSPDVKKIALEQVINYWKKSHVIAEHVKNTEVKLTLPQQKTPSGNTFTIQGIVDLVEENNQTIMYDIKTQDADFVRTHKVDYEGQLNVYAHIWESHQGHHLDGTCIIATGETESLKRAKQRAEQTGTNDLFDLEFEDWDPEVPINLESSRVDSYIQSFGKVVDLIENHCFEAQPVEKLKSHIQDNTTFALRVCSNCDVRFSCDSYRKYALSSGKEKSGLKAFYDDYGSDFEKSQKINVNLKEINK